MTPPFVFPRQACSLICRAWRERCRSKDGVHAFAGNPALLCGWIAFHTIKKQINAGFVPAFMKADRHRDFKFDVHSS